MPKRLFALVTGFALSTAAFATPPSTSPPPAPEHALPEILVTADGLLERVDDPELLIVDVRGSVRPGSQHIPGAAWWRGLEPLGGALPLAQTIVLYDEAPGPSPRITAAFREIERTGHRAVRVLKGGFEGWKAAGGPVTEDPPRLMEPAGSERANTLATPVATVDTAWLSSHFGEPGVEILDVRDGEGWRSYRLSRRFRAGHVPHSLPFSPSSLVADPAVWPDPRSMRRELSALGPRSTEVVDLGSTFVLLGTDRADPEVALGYLLFRMMGLDVRVYDGGWSEWSANPDVPVVRVVGAPEVRWLLTGEPATVAQTPLPEDVVVLDLRESWYFEQGHIPGARLLPAAEFEAGFEETIERELGDLPAETVRLVLYCFGPSCTRSRDCGTLAARRGVRHVLWFRGGLDEWREHGYPVATGTGAEHPGRSRIELGSGHGRESPPR